MVRFIARQAARALLAYALASLFACAGTVQSAHTPSALRDGCESTYGSDWVAVNDCVQAAHESRAADRAHEASVRREQARSRARARAVARAESDDGESAAVGYGALSGLGQGMQQFGRDLVGPRPLNCVTHGFGTMAYTTCQ